MHCDTVPSRVTVAACCFIAVLAAIYLMPIVSAGITGVDLALGQLHAFAEYDKLPLPQAVKLVSVQLQNQRGGWFPLTALEPALWLAFPNPVFSKVLQLMLVVSNLATFTLLVTLLSRSPATGTLAGIGTLLALQLRKPHDAVLGGTYQEPLVFELVLLGLCAYVLFGASGRWAWFALAVILNAGACTMHESGLLLALAFPVVALGRSKRVGAGWPMLFVPALAVSAQIFLHRPAPASLRWIADAPVTGLRLAAEQLVAVLPTSYRAFENVVRDGVNGYFADTRFQSIPPLDGLGWVSTMTGAAAIYAITARVRKPLDRNSILSPTLLAVLLLAAAAMLHNPLEWAAGMPIGEALPSVYFGCFGFGVIFALTARWCCATVRNSSLQAVAPAAFALATFAVLYGNARVNARVVAFERNQYETVNLLDKAGTSHLFQWLPQGAILAFDGVAPLPIDSARFDNVKYLLFAATGRRFGVARLRQACRPGDCHNVWIIRREGRGALVGGLTVAHVATALHSRLLTDQALAYRRYTASPERDAVINALRARARGMRFINVGTESNELVGIILRTCGPVAFDRVYEANNPRWSYESGFFRPNMYKRWDFWVTYYLDGLDSSAQVWRYAGKSADIGVSDGGCAVTPVHFSAFAFTSAPGWLTVSAPGLRQVLKISAAGIHINFIVRRAKRARYDIRFSVNAPAAEEELGVPHFLSDERGPARLVVANPTVEIVQ